MHFAQCFNRVVEKEDTADQGEETPSRKVSDIDVEQSKAKAHCSEDVDQRPRHLHRFDHAHDVAELEHCAARKTYHLVGLAAKGLDHATAGTRYLHPPH